MRRILKILLPALLPELAFFQAGCQSNLHPWVPPEDHQVKIISDAEFVRTGQGEFVEGYLAEYDAEFQKQRMFMALEIAHYLKGERLIVTGRFAEDSVRMPLGDHYQERVSVFEVERAKLNIPKAPDIPSLK